MESIVTMSLKDYDVLMDELRKFRGAITLEKPYSAAALPYATIDITVFRDVLEAQYVSEGFAVEYEPIEWDSPKLSSEVTSYSIMERKAARPIEV